MKSKIKKETKSEIISVSTKASLTNKRPRDKNTIIKNSSAPNTRTNNLSSNQIIINKKEIWAILNDIKLVDNIIMKKDSDDSNSIGNDNISTPIINFKGNEEVSFEVHQKEVIKHPTENSNPSLNDAGSGAVIENQMFIKTEENHSPQSNNNPSGVEKQNILRKILSDFNQCQFSEIFKMFAKEINNPKTLDYFIRLKESLVKEDNEKLLNMLVFLVWSLKFMTIDHNLFKGTSNLIVNSNSFTIKADMISNNSDENRNLIFNPNSGNSNSSNNNTHSSSTLSNNLNLQTPMFSFNGNFNSLQANNYGNNNFNNSKNAYSTSDGLKTNFNNNNSQDQFNINKNNNNNGSSSSKNSKSESFRGSKGCKRNKNIDKNIDKDKEKEKEKNINCNNCNSMPNHLIQNDSGHSFLLNQNIIQQDPGYLNNNINNNYPSQLKYPYNLYGSHPIFGMPMNMPGAMGNYLIPIGFYPGQMNPNQTQNFSFNNLNPYPKSYSNNSSSYFKTEVVNSGNILSNSELNNQSNNINNSIKKQKHSTYDQFQSLNDSNNTNNTNNTLSSLLNKSDNKNLIKKEADFIDITIGEEKNKEEEFDEVYKDIVNIFSKTITDDTFVKLRSFMSESQVNLIEEVIKKNPFSYLDKKQYILLFKTNINELYLKIDPHEKKYTITKRVNRKSNKSKSKSKSKSKRLQD